MDSGLLTTLQKAKEHYAKEGFEIVGVFGSAARDEMTPDSDIDILYELQNTFIRSHHGFSAFSRLNTIRDELRSLLGTDVDLAAKSGLSRTAQRYIMQDLQRV